MRNTFAAVFSVVVLTYLAAPAALAQLATHSMVTPDELVWMEMPSLPPGAQVAIVEGPLNEAVPFTLRLKLPANYEIPAHWHPWIEHATVISGTLNMGTGDRLDRSKTKPLPAGSIAVIQPKTNHFSWTLDETIVQVHGIGPLVIHYVNPGDDPRKK